MTKSEELLDLVIKSVKKVLTDGRDETSPTSKDWEFARNLSLALDQNQEKPGEEFTTLVEKMKPLKLNA